MKQLTYIAFFMLVMAGCATPGTYVLFAHNAKNDDAMRHAITLRMPMELVPRGTRIFCSSMTALVWAEKLDNFTVKVHDQDGEERQAELPSDGAPVGNVTIWPEGQARFCGIDNSSPIGARAYVLWGEFLLIMERTGERQMKYWIHGDILTLNYPLTDENRRALHKISVPLEVANLLY